MKFSANLSTLFTNVPSLIERYRLILKYQFEAIECQTPYNHKLDEWKKVFDEYSTNYKLPKWDLINSIPIYSVFDYIPSKFEFDQRILRPTIDYARFLNVKKVHLVLTDAKNETELKSILELLKYGCEQLSKHSIMCLIEPLSTRETYYLKCYKQAKSIHEKLEQNNLKILLDSYHLQRLNGNLTTLTEQIIKQVGHVQISQIPSRNNPMKKGELDFNYFLQLIASLGYTDYVGLEYNEDYDAERNDQFAWLEPFQKEN